MIKFLLAEPCLTFDLTKLSICNLSAKFNEKILQLTTAWFYTGNILLVIFVLVVYILVFWYFFEKKYRFHNLKSIKRLI